MKNVFHLHSVKYVYTLYSTETAVSLKPTLLLALCPESSFPISHPATWTKLRHAERTSIFPQREAPPPAVRELRHPERTAVTDQGLFHPPCCEGHKPPGRSVTARQSSEKPTEVWFTLTASLPARCPVIHITVCFWVCLHFLVLICWLLARWLIECLALKVLLLPCGSYCLFAWTQSLFSQMYNSPHWSTQQFVVGVKLFCSLMLKTYSNRQKDFCSWGRMSHKDLNGKTLARTIMSRLKVWFVQVVTAGSSNQAV